MNKMKDSFMSQNSHGVKVKVDHGAEGGPDFDIRRQQKENKGLKQVTSFHFSGSLFLSFVASSLLLLIFELFFFRFLYNI